jgi:carbamate kinase
VRVYPHDRAQQLAERYGWTIACDGEQWRRVVASRDPQRIVEQDTVARLLPAQTVVICGGGGGAAVIDDGTGQMRGVEAVVNKDLTSALLAIAVHADRLLVLADVPAVMRHFGTPQAVALRPLDIDELTHLRFPAGSMSPKIEACRRFVAATGQPAAIGALSDATAILAGLAGTTITGRLRREVGPARQRPGPDRHASRRDAGVGPGPDTASAAPSALVARQ